jgi:hypothetical protein
MESAVVVGILLRFLVRYESAPILNLTRFNFPGNIIFAFLCAQVHQIVNRFVREIVSYTKTLYFLILWRIVYPSDLKQIVRRFVR